MQAQLPIRIHPGDDVVIARQQLVGGTVLADEGVTVTGLVPPRHKVAVQAIAQRATVRRYNQIIGTAKRPIEAGQMLAFQSGLDQVVERREAVV